MKSFKQYTDIAESMTSAATIHMTSTVDMAPLYKWLNFGSGKRDKVSNNPTWKKVKKLMGTELEKRASSGDNLAKKVLSNTK